MKHQQFETWILLDAELTQEQHRELQVHLKQCSQCLALYQTAHQLAHLFKTVPVPVPEPDFSSRWLNRIEKTEARKNRVILTATLIGISTATLGLLTSVGFQLRSALAYFPRMMLQLITLVANWIVFLSQLSNIVSPLVRVGAKLISPFWLVGVGLCLSGITAIWIITTMRSRTLQKELQA